MRARAHTERERERVSEIKYVYILQPSNIFISANGQLRIQLGDFGLACPLQKENHHSVFGTHLYAAPEQLEGKCDPKVIKRKKGNF